MITKLERRLRHSEVGDKANEEIEESLDITLNYCSAAEANPMVSRFVDILSAVNDNPGPQPLNFWSLS